MTKHVLLNNVDHKNLRIITNRSAEYGDNIRGAITFSWEFRNVQAEYPIFFSKDPGTGNFVAMSIFGFEEGENLFLHDEGWAANYVPLMVLRDPFLIGKQSAAGGSATGDMIHLDMDSPRVSDSEGEPVFLPHGGVSEFLDSINSMLNTINEGYAANELFLAALAEHDLLESFTLDVQLNDGSDNRLMGFYTINEDALSQLDGDVLADLNDKQFLQPIYMAIASMSNIRNLIDRKNALLA